MKSFAGVRMIAPRDEEEVYRLLLMLEKENAFFPHSEKKVREILKSAINGTGCMCGVIDGPEYIEATMGITFTALWYSDYVYLNEIWCFVHPDHRRSTHLKKLVEWGKYCSDEIGRPIVFSVATLHRLLPKMRLFQRHALQMGAQFVYGLDIPNLFNQRHPEDLSKAS